jgi:hypothetical protein
MPGSLGQCLLFTIADRQDYLRQGLHEYVIGLIR